MINIIVKYSKRYLDENSPINSNLPHKLEDLGFLIENIPIEESIYYRVDIFLYRCFSFRLDFISILDSASSASFYIGMDNNNSEIANLIPNLVGKLIFRIPRLDSERRISYPKSKIRLIGIFRGF